MAGLMLIVFVGAVASLVQRPWVGTSTTFIGRFYVGWPATVAGWWSTLLAAAAVGVSLWARRWASGRNVRQLWSTAALLAVGLSMDEHVRFHVHVVRALGRWTGYTGLPWVPLTLLGLAAVIVVGWWLWRPFMALPRRDRRGIVAGGLCFVAGAVGAEALGRLVYHPTTPSLLYVALSIVEEALEMAGVSIFIWAVYRHLAEPVSRGRLSGGRGFDGRAAGGRWA